MGIVGILSYQYQIDQFSLIYFQGFCTPAPAHAPTRHALVTAIPHESMPTNAQSLQSLRWSRKKAFCDWSGDNNSNGGILAGHQDREKQHLPASNTIQPTLQLAAVVSSAYSLRQPPPEGLLNTTTKLGLEFEIEGWDL